MSDLYLCVDCGGTKTAAAICDASGNIVGRGSGGPSNITYLSPEAFISATKEAVGSALKTAISPLSNTSDTSTSLALPPVGQTPFAAAWFGISGADSPAAIAKVATPLSVLLGLPIGPKLVIANDTHLLAAPMRMHSDVTHAVAVVGGTGSIAVSFRQTPDGKIEELGRIGGWGWVLGDEGSGFDVGRETVRQMLMAQHMASITGQPLVQSVLIDRVLERFRVENIMEVLTGVYQPDPAPGAVIVPGEERELHNLPREKRISSLPPLVFKAAFEHKDPFALNILKTTASRLASQVAILLGEGAGPSSGTVNPANSVVSFGGSLVGVEAYRNLILDNLASRGFVFRRVAFIDNAAAVGATSLAAAFKLASSS
ncbi:hypothetical protein BDZ97DRAFT_1801940 [Flammula alnicola]|nr:hypothetical protein BDZ97DRAFT_1801940 [Flammula alnicola]